VTAGLSPTGFLPKTVEEIVAEFETKQLADIDAGLDTSPESPIGAMNGIVGEAIAENWEVLATLYGAIDPDNAEEGFLENVAAMTGTIRRSATRTLVESVTMTLDATATIPAGTLFSVANSTRTFETLTEVISTTAGAYTVDCQALVEGPVLCLAGTLTNIVSPVTGLTAVTNPTDGILGRNIDTDLILRQRRIEELEASGGSTVGAIAADMLRKFGADGLDDCFVFENDTDETDDAGLPPHSTQVLVDDGASPALDDDDIAQQIFDSKPSGATTYGSESGTAVDPKGGSHTVNFERVERKRLYLYIYIVKDNFAYPTDGDQQIKEALVAFAAREFASGVDVYNLRLKGQVLTIDGVIDVPALYQGYVALPPLQSNITVAPRERVTLASTDITVAYV
jgi:hypothetical protein